MALKNWMSGLSDNILMCNMMMPGAHDAGMVKDLTTPQGMASKDNACCQKYSIAEQLEVGVRWFDIRINGTYRCFHGEVGKPALGEGAENIARAIMRFLDSNPSETVFVALTKCKPHPAPSARENTYLKFLKDLHKYGIQNTMPQVNYATNNRQIAKTSLGDLRGRVVVVMDRPPSTNEDFNYRIVRTKMHKIDPKAEVSTYTPLTFDYNTAQGKYHFILNIIGSYSKKNSPNDINKKQKKFAKNIKAYLVGNPAKIFMSMYYTTNTAPIGLRMPFSSIEKQDKKNWAEDKKAEWSRVAFAASDALGRPLYNVLMMDYADQDRCGYVRENAARLELNNV